MKKGFTVIAAWLAFSANAQEDRFAFDFDLSFGALNYTTDSIVSTGYSYSNLAWDYDGVVHSGKFAHRVVQYKCISIMPHFGFSVPLLKRDPWSLGLSGSVGIGTVRSLKEPYILFGEEVDYPEEWEEKFRSRALDCTAYGYLRYNLQRKSYIFGHVTLYGGIRRMNVSRTIYRYTTPVIGLRIGGDSWAIGWNCHFTKITHYRQLSNGQVEPMLTFSDIGAFSLHYYLTPRK